MKIEIDILAGYLVNAFKNNKHDFSVILGILGLDYGKDVFIRAFKEFRSAPVMLREMADAIEKRQKAEDEFMKKMMRK